MFGRLRGKAGAAAVAASLLISLAAPASPAAAAIVITVTTTAPGIDGDASCSLQEAIYAANLDASEAPDPADPLGGGTIHTGCFHGVGAVDTIVLPASAVFSLTSPVDDPSNPVGPTATPLITSGIILEANGSRIQRTGAALMRAFAVGPTGSLVLRNAHVKDFYARGGNGGQLGGGGGLGAGGGIYVKEGSLSVEGSTFESNRAEGGNGGDAVNTPNAAGSNTVLYGGGGGGGLSGAGGWGGGGAPFGDGFINSAGGGGGGGARGNGGDAVTSGGGGGGTLSDAHAFGNGGASIGGDRCGGDGGASNGTDGQAGCDGGGGGGGSIPATGVVFCCDGVPGTGGYGGGGGGGGRSETEGYGADGARGGFGGGGGAGGEGGAGGGGGFGAGGGGGDHDGGNGGTFGGDGGHIDPAAGFDSIGAGGGGAGLGGAIFSDDGTVNVLNSTFGGNSASHGFAGATRTSSIGQSNGSDAGAAIFAVDGTLNINNTTIAGNVGTGSSAGLAMYHSTRDNHSATLKLNNTIVADNGRLECQLFGSVAASGSHNLFTWNGNCPASSSQFNASGLLDFAIHSPGSTPTMAIDETSPAFDNGDDATCEPFDQRDVSRPRSIHCDIGAYEYVKPSADLSVATTALNTPVAGGTARFLIQLTNNGPTAAAGATLTITPPTGTTSPSVSNIAGLNCLPTAPITCYASTFAEGRTAALTLTVGVPAATSTGTQLRVDVSASSTTPDPVPANNSAAAWVYPTVRADVAIGVTGPSSPVAGTNTTYTMTVTNNGPSNVPPVTVSDVVPSGTTFQSVGTPIGGSCTKPAVGGPGVVSCTTSALTPGGSSTFSMVVRVNASSTDGSQLCDTAAVTSTIPDPVPSDDSAVSCGTVRTSADVAVSQTVTTVGKAGKGTATFTLVVANPGPSDAQNVVLSATLTLFSGPKPTTTTTQGATCTVTGQTVACSWTTIAVGGNGQVVISVPWRSSVGPVCTTGSVTVGTPDPNPANNTATGCIGKR